MEPTAHQLNSYLDKTYGTPVDVIERLMDERAESADEAMDNPVAMHEIVYDFADSEVVESLIRSIVRAVRYGNNESCLVFAKALNAEITLAALNRQGAL